YARMNPITKPIARAIVKSGITSDREDWLGEKFSVNSKEFTDVRATFYGLGEWTEAQPSRRRGGSARLCPRHDKASFRSPSGIVMMLTHAGETKQAATLTSQPVEVTDVTHSKRPTSPSVSMGPPGRPPLDQRCNRPVAGGAPCRTRATRFRCR